MMNSTETLLLDHYHCTFFLPLLDLDKSGFIPKGNEWKYATEKSLKALQERTEADIIETDTLQQALDIAEEKSNNIDFRSKNQEAEAQAYRYFSPALRNILFNCSAGDSKKQMLQPIKEWRLPQEMVDAWQLHLGDEIDKEDPLKYQQAQLTSVILYQYFNGIYLLAFSVAPKALLELKTRHAPKQIKHDEFKKWTTRRERKRREESTPTAERQAEMAEEKQQETLELARLKQLTEHPFFSDNAPNWFLEMKARELPKEELALYAQLQLESWLHFTRLARLIYPTFPQQNDENKIAPISLITHYNKENETRVTAFDTLQKVAILEKPGEDISPVICELLKAFAEEPADIKAFLDGYQNIYDDRMFVSVAYGLAGKQLPQEQLEKLFYLTLYVDRHEDAWMEGYAYTPETLGKLARSRRFDFWNWAGGYYGYTEFSNVYLSRGYEFRSFIAPEHVPQIYDRMLIQALFYQASLRYYDNLISQESSHGDDNRGLESIRTLREQFIRFTNGYWFHHLTDQIQGREIFRLQQAGLGLKEHYDIIKDELERTDEYLQTKHEIRISEFTRHFTIGGLVVAFLALYYAAVPLLSTEIRNVVWGLLWGLTSLEPFWHKQFWLLAFPLILLTFVGVPFAIIRVYKRFRDKNS